MEDERNKTMMNNIKKFFDVQLGNDVCPPAKEKLLKKILPELCVENDICPLCSGDLVISDSGCVAFVNANKKCPACKAVFKGEKSYGRSADLKSTPFIQR